jgi:hypothetical protein
MTIGSDKSAVATGPPSWGRLGSRSGEPWPLPAMAQDLGHAPSAITRFGIQVIRFFFFFLI